MAFGWLKKVVRTAGKPIKKVAKVVGKPVKLAAKAGRSVGRQLRKVPVVGGGLKGVFDLTLNAPFQVAGRIANGERIDKVALNTLRDRVRSVQAVAPYAQTVISIVPAIGPGINAGLGAGLALAAGQPISAALAAGVKSALPGGPLAASIFEASKAVVEGKPFNQIVLSTIPLDGNAKRGLAMALDVSSRLARGQRVDKALLAQADGALKLLPIDARKALSVGAAIGEAQKLQKIALSKVSAKGLTDLARGGRNLINASPVLRSAASVLKTSGARDGYAVGVSVMNTQRPQPFHVAAIRNRLNLTQRAGFDMAVAAHAGMVKSRTVALPSNATASQRLGYYVARGLPNTVNAPRIITAVRKNPATKAGANAAVRDIQATQPGLWERFKTWLLGGD